MPGCYNLTERFQPKKVRKGKTIMSRFFLFDLFLDLQLFFQPSQISHINIIFFFFRFSTLYFVPFSEYKDSYRKIESFRNNKEGKKAKTLGFGNGRTSEGKEKSRGLMGLWASDRGGGGDLFNWLMGRMRGMGGGEYVAFLCHLGSGSVYIFTWRAGIITSVHLYAVYVAWQGTNWTDPINIINSCLFLLRHARL